VVTAGEASRAILLQRFVADEVKGQCGFGQDKFRTPLGVWSAPIYLNTDARPGGCLQSFALVDPDGELLGWSLFVDLGGVWAPVNMRLGGTTGGPFQ
jgi:hypothetical protein